MKKGITLDWVIVFTILFLLIIFLFSGCGLCSDTEESPCNKARAERENTLQEATRAMRLERGSDFPSKVRRWGDGRIYDVEIDGHLYYVLQHLNNVAMVHSESCTCKVRNTNRVESSDIFNSNLFGR